jgi:DNA repair protein RecO (recombination protein O)
MKLGSMLRAVFVCAAAPSRVGSARRRIMPARETEAIILRTYPLGEADRLVSFLGRTTGRVRGVASGARRLKNRYGSTLELLSHVQLWFVERETRDLVRIQQCDLLESFHRAQSDYGLSTGLAVVSEIVERILPEHEAAEPMFRLVLLTAREIERRGDWTLPLAYFSFWSVKLGGWLPSMSECASCGSALGQQPGFHWNFGPGIYCSKCQRAGMRQLLYQGRELAESFAGRRLDQLDLSNDKESAVQELREAALNWIEYHTEKKLPTRELLEKS